MGLGNDGKEAKPDERRSFQPAAAVISIAFKDRVVKPLNGLVQLSADAANEPVTKRRHLAERDDGPAFSLTVGLCKDRQRKVSFGHRGTMSRSEYSGSF